MKKKQQQIIRLHPEIDCGLSQDQVLQRKKDKLFNSQKSKASKSVLKIICENLFTFFNFIWAIIFLALLWVGSYNDLLFAIVIFMNTSIAIIQELRAKHTVEKLRLLSTPKVKVVRNGIETLISSKDIVLDDIIILESGNQVPADLIILNGTIEVNESLLTGESEAVKKEEGASILAGSFLTSGKCVCRAEKVGKDLYISSIAKEAKKFSAPKSNLFKDLKSLIKYVGIFIIPMAALLFVNNYIGQHATLKVAISKTCGSLVGMIPAGMFLLVTIALAVGVVKLSKKNTLIQDIYSIEMLARTNVLCLDKTGTITDGTMNVLEVVKLGNDDDLPIDKIVSNIMSCQPTENPTSRALINKFGKAASIKYLANLPFSSDRKQTITTFKKYGTFALGAFEYININKSKTLTQKINNYSRAGYRVLLLASNPNEINDDKIEGKFNPVALIILEDHIRPDAKDTIKWFIDNDVEIKIISGDNPNTVANIANRVGVPNSDKCISLDNMSIEQVIAIADKYTIFGRVTPEQKHAIIKTLKSKGKIVGMTGDGVNDTLALKEADCSIAMADGSDVARNIANVVLMDSKFSSLPKVVEEGRQVINNIQNSSSLFLMKTAFTIVLSLVTLLTFSLYPFAPAQMFMLELFVIGIPSVFLALQPNKDRIKGQFLSTVIKKCLPYSAIMLFNVGIVLVLYRFNFLSLEELNTLSTIVITSIGYLCLVKICFPYTKLKILCLGISLALIIFASTVIPDFFNMAVFSPYVFKVLAFCTCFTSFVMIVWIWLEMHFKRKQAKKQIV